MTYEQIMYEKILAHQYCTQRFGETGDEQEDNDFCEEGTAIVITNYDDGSNVAIECVQCNEVIIDFNRSAPKKESAMTTKQHDHINCYLDSKPHDQEWHNDRFYELSVHPDFCDEACPDYMETGKFCGTEEEKETN